MPFCFSLDEPMKQALVRPPLSRPAYVERVSSRRVLCAVLDQKEQHMLHLKFVLHVRPQLYY